MDNARKFSADLAQEYPFEPHYYEQPYGTNSVARQHYLDEGTGPVVVMLHGNPTWSFYFRNCIRDLKKKGFADEIRSDKGIANEVKPMIHTPASIFQENAESNTTRRSSLPNNSLAGSCMVMWGYEGII